MWMRKDLVFRLHESNTTRSVYSFIPDNVAVSVVYIYYKGKYVFPVTGLVLL